MARVAVGARLIRWRCWQVMVRSVAVLLVFGTTGSCTLTEEPSASMELSDSAGDTVVENHEPRWGDGEAWSVSFEPRLTIGATHGRSEYQLFDVSAAARQSDGDIVIVDGCEVRVYGRNGTFIRTLGGPGSGPGEFQDPAQLLKLFRRSFASVREHRVL